MRDGITKLQSRQRVFVIDIEGGMLTADDLEKQHFPVYDAYTQQCIGNMTMGDFIRKCGSGPRRRARSGMDDLVDSFTSFEEDLYGQF